MMSEYDRGRHEPTPGQVSSMRLAADPATPPSTNRSLVDAVQWAVHTDTVLTPQSIKETWSDAFLTNVMVPVLRHIAGVQEAALEELEEEETTKNPVERAFNVQMQDDLSSKIISLSRVILVLQEWRG